MCIHPLHFVAVVKFFWWRPSAPAYRAEWMLTAREKIFIIAGCVRAEDGAAGFHAYDMHCGYFCNNANGQRALEKIVGGRGQRQVYSWGFFRLFIDAAMTDEVVSIIPAANWNLANIQSTFLPLTFSMKCPKRLCPSSSSPIWSPLLPPPEEIRQCATFQGNILQRVGHRPM